MTPSSTMGRLVTCVLCVAGVDEPPRSDAGQDVVIQLPTDWAVLDGRDSVDDHGIERYEWSLVKGDTAISMKVSFSGGWGRGSTLKAERAADETKSCCR